MFLTAVDGPSGRLATYVYDSESKRRRIYEGAAFTTLVWDGWDYLQWRRPSGTHVFHTMNGEIVGESVGGVVRDYLLDPLGSVVATLDSDGLVDQFEYWPYGELVDDLPAGAPVFLWVGGLGYWFDTDERRYVRHRMLRTDLGSWMQFDPFWPVTQALNYIDSPVDITDPTGRHPDKLRGKQNYIPGILGLNFHYGNCCGWNRRCDRCSETVDCLDDVCKEHDINVTDFPAFFGQANKSACEAVKKCTCTTANGLEAMMHCNGARNQLYLLFCGIEFGKRLGDMVKGVRIDIPNWFWSSS